MKVYSPADIAKLLEVKESTLRKYSILLEDHGYKFQRNNQNQRWYNDSDITALRKLVTLKSNTDMSLKECAEQVYLWVNGSDITQPSTVVHNDIKRHDNDITELKTLMSELINKMDQQQKYIDERLNKHDELLVQSLRESMETRKQLAAAQQEEENKKNKGFFNRLFRR